MSYNVDIQTIWPQIVMTSVPLQKPEVKCVLLRGIRCQKGEITQWFLSVSCLSWYLTLSESFRGRGGGRS